MKFCLIVFLTLIGFSCNKYNESKSTNQNSTSIDSTYQTKNDSSQWLKPTRGIRGILEDSKGNFWFTSSDYVCMYDGAKFTYFTKEDGLNNIGVVHEDSNKSIWIEDGFNVYQYDGNQFITNELVTNSSSIPLQKTDNSIWFQKGINHSDTTYSELGAIHFNQGKMSFSPFPISKSSNTKFLYFPTTRAIHGKDNTIWFGTMEKVFGFQNNSFIELGRSEMGRENDARQMGIRGLFVDSKGKLWIADNGAGIFVYDGKKVVNFTKKHHLDEGDKTENKLHRVFSIAEDTLGNMWFGTVYSGVWKFNPTTLDFEIFSKDNGILSENIWTIYKTKNGKLLFAGESPGAVYEYNGKSFERKY